MMGKAILTIKVGVAILFAGLFVSLFLTNPNQLGPFGLTAWFSALMIAVTGLLVLGLVRWRYGRTREGMILALRRGFILAMVSVSLLALSSLRQLGIRDIILLIVLGMLIDFYMQRIQR